VAEELEAEARKLVVVVRKPEVVRTPAQVFQAQV
jgi:hypothetical protein